MRKLVIDKKKCTLCGKCVDVCPKKVYEIKEKIVVPVYENECIACGHCVAICDKLAITHNEMNIDDFIEIPEDIKIDAEKFRIFMRSRRSIRKYLDKEVPQELIDILIDVGRYSPTGRNFENVEFIVIKNKNKIRELANLTVSFLKFGVFLLKSNVVRFIAAGIMGKKTIEKLSEMIPTFERLEKYWKKGEDLVFHGAPVVIVSYAEKSDQMAKDNCDLALCHIMLMAEALGLGTCHIGLFTYAAQRSCKIKKTLGIPKGHKIFGTLVVGYSKYKYKRLVSRKLAKVRYL